MTSPGPAAPLHPRTAYSTAYTVPMELLKRERTLAAAPLPGPHGGAQLLRKPGLPADPSPPATGRPEPSRAALALPEGGPADGGPHHRAHHARAGAK